VKIKDEIDEKSVSKLKR